MSDVFRMGLVGGGRMGKTHLRALAGSNEVAIVAVAEPSEPTAAGLRQSGMAVYPTAASMLAGGGIDGVLIAVPTDQHLALIRELARTGLPVLCEKPCGVDVAQARDIAKLVSRSNTRLQVAYWRRFVPALQDLREKIASGGLGALHYTVCAQWDEAPPSAEFASHSGGIFVDMGVHEIDQIRWLTGLEVADVAVSAFPSDGTVDLGGDVASAQALLTLSDGSAATISLGRFHPGGDLVAVEIFGSHDHVRVGVLEPPDGEAPQLEALRRQAEAFARWANGGPAEGATIDDATAALVVAGQLTEAAGLASKAGRSD